jgi:hypothetical protein
VASHYSATPNPINEKHRAVQHKQHIPRGIRAHGNGGTAVRKRKAGRPTILTGELTRKICGLIEAANSIAVTCGLVGVSQSAFFEWQRRGDAGEEAFVQFSQA